jgi:hypothetical protein
MILGTNSLLLRPIVDAEATNGTAPLTRRPDGFDAGLKEKLSCEN